MTVTFLSPFESVPLGEYGLQSANGDWPIAHSNPQDGYNLQGGCAQSHCKVITSDTDSDGTPIVARNGEGKKFIRINVRFDDDWDYEKVRIGGCADRARIQLNKKNIGGSGNGVFQFGVEYWVGISIYLPKSHVEDSKQENLWGLLGEKNTNQGVQIYTNHGTAGAWKVTHQQRDSGGVLRGTKLYLSDYSNDLGKWVDWAFNVKFAETGGFIYVYKNKTLVGQTTGRTVDENWKSPYMSLVGPKIYKPGWRFGASLVNERIVYFDEQRQSDLTTIAGLDEVSPGDTGTSDEPFAVDDDYTVEQGQTLTVSAPGVLSNDIDNVGNGLTAVLDTPPDQDDGNFVLNADGSFSYPHDGVGSGTDTFTYHVVDDNGQVSNTATVSINIEIPSSGGAAELSVVGVNEVGLNRDLTALAGTLTNGTWAHWGRTATADYNHKNNNTDISDIDRTDLIDRYTSQVNSYDWSDGETDGDAVATETGLADVARIYGLGEKTFFTYLADTKLRRLVLFVGNHQNRCSVAASLSDASAPDQSVNLGTLNVNTQGHKVTIDHRAASDGQMLTVTVEVIEQGTAQNTSIEAAYAGEVPLATTLDVTTNVETDTDVFLHLADKWSYYDPNDGEPFVNYPEGGENLIQDFISSGLNGFGTLGLGQGFSLIEGHPQKPVAMAYEIVPRLDATSPGGSYQEIVLPATTVERTYRVFVGAMNTSMDFDVSLDDASAADNLTVLDAPDLNKVVWGMDVTVKAASTTVARVRIRPNTAHGSDWRVFMGPVVINKGAISGNTPPTISQVAQQNVKEGQTVAVTITGTNVAAAPDQFLSWVLDPESLTEIEDTGGEVSLVDNGDNTADFSWITALGDLGTHDIRVFAHNGEKIAQMTFQVVVAEADGYIVATAQDANDTIRLDSV